MWIGSPLRGAFRLFSYVVLTLVLLPPYLLAMAMRIRPIMRWMPVMYHRTVCFILGIKVQVRGTYGSFRTRAAESGQPGNDASGGPLIVPVLTTRVDYGTIGVSYEFWEGDYTSGLFAGIGAYKLRPNDAPPGFEEFRDPQRTVFGWHAGVDGTFKIVNRFSLVGRLTFHRFSADTGRSILTADAGFQYRF